MEATGLLMNLFVFDVQIVSQLLNYQARLNVKDYKSNTPLHFCCINGHLQPANVLLRVLLLLLLLLLLV